MKTLYYRFALFLLAMTLISGLNGQIIFKEPLSNRIANYDMSVKLNPTKKVVSGVIKLHWTNTSADTLTNLQFHTYLNAFKNNRSTFFMESGGQLRGDYFDKSNKDEWGWINIQSISYIKGVNLTKRMKYIQPDDGNADDQTVVEIKLPDSIMPGKSIDLEISFESKLPKIHARTGFSDEYFFVAQWFPKIGVYEPAGMRGAKKGRWNCHQFHSNTEFYADYGVYDVKIELPKDFIVGSTGVLQKKSKSGDNNQVLHFRAEDVIDFAWTASKHFMVVNTRHEEVDIILLMQPEHLDQANRHIDAAKSAISYLNASLGKYPYPNLTIVDPPFRGSGSGGMEYPCLITAGTISMLPEGIKVPEMVTVHEYGHQYFMGLLASNEFEEAWLDEGLNTYFETRIMNKAYGEKTSMFNIFGFKVGDIDFQRSSYLYADPKIGETYRNAWEFTHGGYGTLNYSKPATWLTTLERMLGRETMDEIMKTYYAKWKFKHPSTTDFIQIASEVTAKHHGTKFGIDLNWFFNEMLFTSNICDYKVYYVRNRLKSADLGYYDDAETMSFKTSDPKDSSKIYLSKILLKREGEVVMPVDVLVHFDNGTEIKELWDGKSRTCLLKYEKPAKVLWVKIDPENKLVIDINRNNNSYSTVPDKTGMWEWISKLMFYVQNIMASFAILA
jgi:hypothetical protein